jgi:hypothetical protein
VIPSLFSPASLPMKQITKVQIESFYEAEFGKAKNVTQKAMRDICVEVIERYEEFRNKYQKLLNRIAVYIDAGLTNFQDKAFWLPKVGDLIYINTSAYIDRGEDDVCGGLAVVSKVKDMGEQYKTNRYFVTLVEIDGHQYGWGSLLEQQASLYKEFGFKRAHPCPDDGG